MNIQNVHFHIGSPLTAAALAALMSFDTDAPAARPAPPGSPPAIGGYWQGQGGIYVGIGRGFDGAADHHLILPTDPRAIFNKRQLGTYGTEVKGADSDSNGMANTIAFAAAGSDLCKAILGLEIDGHKDFYLMSRTDARLCMANVPEQFEKEWYLTSTQYSDTCAWLQTFGYGSQSIGGKKFEARARAVRRLIL